MFVSASYASLVDFLPFCLGIGLLLFALEIFVSNHQVHSENEGWEVWLGSTSIVILRCLGFCQSERSERGSSLPFMEKG